MRPWIKIVYVLFIVAMISSCSSKTKEETPVKTILKINIYDDNNVVLWEDEVVYLFSDEAAYLSSLEKKSPIGFDYETTSSGGIAVFEDVNFGVKYYIYISHEKEDYAINNFFENKRLRNGLLEGTTTTINVKLLPFNVGRLAFWSKSTNDFQFDIQVVFDGESIGNVNVGKSTTPTSVNDANVLPIFYQEAGDYSWYAKGANGCYWEGSLSVKEETFYPIELAECSMGKIVFEAGNLLGTYSEIKIILGQNDDLGSLTSTNSIQGACGKGLEVARALGEYNYQAVYDDACVEFGRVSIAEDCQKVILKGCK